MVSVLRHRHFVAFPTVLAVIVTVLFVSGSLGRGITASVLPASFSDAGILALEDGMQILRGEGGSMDISADVPVLARGPVLVSHPGLFQVQTGTFTLQGMAGAFHAVKNGSTVTVSAITSPVLVQDGERNAIVPVGYQWRGEGEKIDHIGIEPLPLFFVRAQLLALAGFPAWESLLPPVTQNILSDEQSLRLFPAARERAADARRLSVLGALRGRIERQDRGQALELLADGQVFATLDDSRSLPALVILAAESCTSMPDVCAQILAHLKAYPDVWVLAAYHPDLRTVAWSGSIPALSDEARDLLVFTLLPSDRFPVSLAPVILPWWEAQMRTMLFASRNRPERLSDLFSATLPAVRGFAEGGYPERAEKMTQSLRRAAESVGLSLTMSQEDALRAVEATAAGKVKIDLLAAPSPVEASEQQVSSSLSAERNPKGIEHVAQAATALLEQTDAIFTTETRFVTLDDQRVRVYGLLFAGSVTDHRYDFDLNVADHTVASVVRDDKEYPNALSLEKFLSWVRK